MFSNKNYLYIILFLSLTTCKCGGNAQIYHHYNTEYARIKSLSSNYEIDQLKSKKGKLYINEKHAFWNKKLCPMSIYFEKPMKVSTLQLQSINHNQTKYILYLNGRYTGGYADGDKIQLNKKVSSIRVIYSKTDEEIAVRGWDNKYYYTLLRDTSTYTNSNKTVILEMADTNVVFRKPLVFRQPKNKSIKNLKYLDFVNKGSRLILQNKSNNSLIDQTACFYEDNHFFIDFIKVNNNRKIEHHYFLCGNWYFANRKGKLTEINLNGKFEGRLSKNDDYQVFNYNKSVFIDSLNIIRSDDFLDNLMVDLPDWVMVRVADFKADFVIDLPYASNNNFTRKKLYDCNECYLRYATVKDLLKAQRSFNKLGFRLKMLDCYRPYHIQRKLFEAFPVPGYVASPIGGSVHNKGSAVDLTLVDANGEELNMGTKFDDLSRKSNHSYKRFPDTVLNNRRLLLRVMKANNFNPIRTEWWHYNHGYAKRYKKIDDAFPCR